MQQNLQFFQSTGACSKLIQFLKYMAYIGNLHVMHIKDLSNTHSSMFKVK